MTQFTIEWHDSGREPQCPADPNFPNGIDIDGIDPGEPACKTDLPYPAERVGMFRVTCTVCRGGPHRASNLQLLCMPCNRRKNARDPIDHMQSLGFLL